MVELRYRVCYTKQKHKKRKKWLDGFFVVSSDKRAKLYANPDGVSNIGVDIKKKILASQKVSFEFLQDDEELDFGEFLIQNDGELKNACTAVHVGGNEILNNEKDKISRKPIDSTPKPINDVEQRKEKYVNKPKTNLDVMVVKDNQDQINSSNYNKNSNHKQASDGTPKFSQRILTTQQLIDLLIDNKDGAQNSECITEATRSRFTKETSVNKLESKFKAPTLTKPSTLVACSNGKATSMNTVKSLGQLRLRLPDGNDKIKRKVRIPSHFAAEDSIASYRKKMIPAVLEEIQIAIEISALKLVKACNSQSFQQAVKKEGIFVDETASMYKKVPKPPRKRYKNSSCGQQHQSGLVDVEEKDDTDGEIKYFIFSKKTSGAKTLSMNDIWFVTKQNFNRTFDMESVWLFRSVWHGSTEDGTIQVVPISNNIGVRAISTNWGSKTAVKVIQGPNMGQYMDMLGVFSGLSNSSPPILPHLFDHSLAPSSISLKLMRKNFNEDTISNWESSIGNDLNEDQRYCLHAVSDWFRPNVRSDPVIMVHGIFGSGKTKLLVSVIKLIAEILDAQPVICNTKICVTSSTNVAVDKILLELDSMGYSNIARIGSKKIDPRVRKYAVHETDVGTGSEKAEQARVVGVTCSASSFDIMKKLFPKRDPTTITIVDECFQIPESLSMMPIYHAHTSRLILVGDPLQLPPVTNIMGDSCSKESLSYSDPLYRRLQLTREPTILRTQYRCHPKIANLASRLFYKNEVINGIDCIQRQPLIQENDPLLFLDVTGTEQRMMFDSFSNQKEQQVVKKLVKSLFGLGIDPNLIGVAALYRAQAFQLSKEIPSVQVSTVDAFQGSEKEIIIVTTTRTTSVGFTDNKQRLNVMLTRARTHFIVVGHIQTLKKSSLWRQLLSECSPLVLCM